MSDIVYFPVFHDDDLEDVLDRLTEALRELGLEVTEVDPEPDEDMPNLHTLLEITLTPDVDTE